MCINASCRCIDVIILAEVTMTNDIPKRYSKEIEHD